MSFIDLMSNNVFSEADILKRTESMIRTHYSEEQETILNRKMTGVITGSYSLSPEEGAEIQDFSYKVMEARQANIDATADNELLKQIIETEKAYLFLKHESEEYTDEELAQKTEAQAVVDQASPTVMEWVLLRNPETQPLEI